METIVRESEDRFLFIGGRLCLDFLNTEIMRDGQPTDLLQTPDDWTAWLVAAGLERTADSVPVETHFDEQTAVNEKTIEAAKELRGALRAVVVAATQGKPAPTAALETINATLAAGTTRQELRETESGQFAADTIHEGGPLPLLAEAGMDLLCHQDLSLVRQCEGTGCILWFLDTTKNHKRRWCRMSVCGNRHKAATHYRKGLGVRG